MSVGFVLMVREVKNTHLHEYLLTHNKEKKAF